MEKSDNETWTQFWFNTLNFNNFYLKFPSPGSVYGYSRGITEELGWWDEKMRENGGGSSPKYLSLTYREYYAELDATVRDLGIDYDEFCRQLYVFMDHDGKGEDWEEAGRFSCENAQKIMTAMIGKGYIQYDLTA